MSAGNFTNVGYKATYDDTNIHPIRVQPETVACTIDGVANASGGNPNIPISAKVSGSQRSIGLTPRKVTLQFTGALPDGYAVNSTVTIPALTAAFYAKCVKGSTGTYLTKPVKVVSASPEVAK